LTAPPITDLPNQFGQAKENHSRGRFTKQSQLFRSLVSDHFNKPERFKALSRTNATRSMPAP
jgi:hypothetical protein